MTRSYSGKLWACLSRERRAQTGPIFTESEIKMESSRYYKPTLLKENPLPLEEGEISYARELLEMSENKTSGFIPLRVEEEVVVQRISNDLYAKPESGLRELYNNEARACRTAEKTFGAKPSIVISLDPSSRELEIRGIDSTGISTETFRNVYTVLGRSSNFSGEEIGQFGFGRNAFCTLSDVMVIETKYRTPEGETGEYAVMAKNGVGFNVLPKPNVGAFGTVAKLVLKPGVDLRSLVEYIHDACIFSKIPTYLNLASDLPEERVSWRSETRFPGGSTQLSKTYEQRAQEKASRSFYHGREDGGKLVKTFRISFEGAELYAEFRVGEKEYYDHFPTMLKIGKETRLLGSPIEMEIDLPFSFFILNVLDERKFAPTADRERLREEACNALKDIVSSRVSEELSSYLSVTTLQEYLALDQDSAAVFLSEKNSWEDDPSSISRFLSVPARNLRSLLLRELIVRGDGRGYRRYNTRTLASLLREKTPCEIFFQPFGTKFSSSQIDRITERLPQATFIQFVTKRTEALQEIVRVEEMLREMGILSLGEYVRTNRARLKPKDQAKGSVRIFESVEGCYSWGRFAKATLHFESVTSADPLPENVIRVPRGSVRKYTRLLSRLKTSYKLVKEIDGLRGGVSLRDFIKTIQEREYLTSGGKKKLKDLVGLSKQKIWLHLYSDPRLADYFKEQKEVRIFNEEDEIFMAALFLTYHSTEFLLDTEMVQLFDGELEGALNLSGETNLSRRNLLRDHRWSKLGDSEILGSVLHIFKAVKDDATRFLFARAVAGSKQASEVSHMRKTLLALSSGEVKEKGPDN